MSTGYGWEGIRQVCATLLGARHVPRRLCGGAYLQRGAITSVRPLPYLFIPTDPGSAGVFNVSMTTVTSPQSSTSAGETEASVFMDDYVST